MNIKDIPEIKNWLDQFDVPDSYLAEYMLKKVRYVGFEEFESWLQSEITELLTSLKSSSGKSDSVALFPVTKSMANKFNEGKEPKAANDSSGRIGHSLRNIERRLPKNVELSPRLESMKACKVKHIVFVDDLIGTGERFTKFWKTVHKSIKSWHSRGWCKIWLVSFAAHENGMKRIVREINALNIENIQVNLRFSTSFIDSNKDLKELCRKYGKRLTGGNSVVSFGKQLSPIVFQHGCPNNAPGIFWCEGTKSTRNFFPLFPNRSIPETLYPLFLNELGLSESAEDLWIARQYKAAVNFFDNFRSYNGRHDIFNILSYIKAGKKIEQIRVVMVMTNSEFNKIIDEIKMHGLVDDGETMTRFGNDILLRGSRLKSNDIKHVTEYTNFYPRKFLGFQREV
jgi:hypothetical protein